MLTACRLGPTNRGSTAAASWAFLVWIREINYLTGQAGDLDGSTSDGFLSAFWFAFERPILTLTPSSSNLTSSRRNLTSSPGRSIRRRPTETSAASRKPAEDEILGEATCESRAATGKGALSFGQGLWSAASRAARNPGLPGDASPWPKRAEGATRAERAIPGPPLLPLLLTPPSAGGLFPLARKRGPPS